MGLLNSKKSAPEESTSSPGNLKNLGENRIATRKEKIAYVNQYISVLRGQKTLPEYLLVRKKKTDLLVDEDGYTAHEFYEETISNQSGVSKIRLVRRTSSLKPLEFVDYKIPRLDCNLNLVLWQAE
ncbi:hypothetical protein QR680_005578 [Steinernema hermaphroditum]|uniref:Uncharacterized protein n=1 Tax=Steinernema hermaphroditum TaxID=289476 RepID=A0AA39HSJ1_9BILA|nr:hypothetical protein QR680_005578 [Steinernema hermaphroditum]